MKVRVKAPWRHRPNTKTSPVPALPHGAKTFFSKHLTKAFFSADGHTWLMKKGIYLDYPQ